jgi:branched-chain amino acid transport system substrate-binding protein
MKKHMKRALPFLLILLLLTTFGCAKKEPAAADPGTAPVETKEPVRIGFFAPVTGAAASDGKSATNSAELAVKLINEKGGINGQLVELVKYDDGLDTKQAVNIAQKLTTKDNVVAVVSGSYSGPTRVAAPIFQEAGMPMLSAYAIHPDVTASGDFIFSQSFSGAVQGTAGAKIAVEKLGAKRISILAVDIDFGKTLSEAFTAYATANGAEIVSVDKFGMPETEFSPVLTKIKETVKPDLLYIACYPSHGTEIARQSKRLGLNVQILGTEGIDSVQFLEVAKEDAEGVIITTNMDRDSKEETVQNYITAYKAEYGTAPDMVGASTYDAFETLFKVIAENGTDPVAIRDGVKVLKNFETVTGRLLEYAPSRVAVKAVQIQIVKDGEFHYYDVVTDDAIIRQ